MKNIFKVLVVFCLFASSYLSVVKNDDSGAIIFLLLGLYCKLEIKDYE